MPNVLTTSALDDTTRRRALRTPGTPGWLTRIAEPTILFPVLTIIVLGVIWSSTFNLIKVERTNAMADSAAATLALVNSYEAQVVRALREIDQTLRLVEYVYETRGVRASLSELKARILLPPDLLFVVRVFGPDGAVLGSTRDGEVPLVAEREVLTLMQGDSLWIDKPRKDRTSGEWTLQFGRGLHAADGAFAGAVVIAVDASYFVSGYDPSILGSKGVLGLLGTDGVFRARRTGDTVTAGERADYVSAVPSGGQEEPTVALSVNRWDGVQRFTGAQKLYEFPLAVIAGLSKDEQLEAASRRTHIYLWRAALGSGLLIVLTTILGRLSWQLARSRVRENEAKLTHALRIEYLAYHDGLTALPNRSLFNKLLSQATSQAQRHQKQLAVAFIDLDRFKQINDTLGHEAGDELLKQVATRLKTCLRESDIVARLGGDEFVVLLTDLQEEHYAATVAQRIVTEIANPFVLMDHELHVTASIGISIYPLDGQDEQTLTKNADIAMYQAKEDGKNKFQFYSERLNANSLERLTLESSLRHALERNEFELYYQPKREIVTGRITGMEALLRWRHPDLGTVAPLRFLPVAEDTGLIVPIGRWVLQAACLQNVTWQSQGLPRLNVAVNLSARQFFDENLVRDVASVLKTTGMEAWLLELEIHESLLIHNIEKTLQILTGLKALGVRIAIDDFGAGYSSLATLQRFPLDTIKIDRSFIRDVATTSKDRGLTDAIISMGKSLSLTVVAQGVETSEQAEFLRDHACDEIQGFYFNRPLPAESFKQLLLAPASEMTYIGRPSAVGAG